MWKSITLKFWENFAIIGKSFRFVSPTLYQTNTLIVWDKVKNNKNNSTGSHCGGEALTVNEKWQILKVYQVKHLIELMGQYGVLDLVNCSLQ